MAGDGAAYVFPAEFEPHERVWLSWPHDPREVIRGRPFHPVLLDMIEALLPFVRVAVIVNDPHTEGKEITEALRVRCDGRRRRRRHSQQHHQHDVELHAIQHSSIWMRDFGPIFVRRREREGTPDAPMLRVVAFRWSMWGNADRWRAAVPPETFAGLMGEGEVPRRVAHALGLATIDADFVSEGGDREFNGEGTLMVTEAVQLQRNPHLTKEQLTERYKQLFNVRKVIWLKRGVAEDDQIFAGPLPGGIFPMPCTGGHIDEVHLINGILPTEW